MNKVLEGYIKTDRKFTGLNYKAHSKQRKQKVRDELQRKQKDSRRGKVTPRKAQLCIVLVSNVHSRGFPGGPVVKDSTVPMQGARVQSLVGELRFCTLYSKAKKKKKIIHSNEKFI